MTTTATLPDVLGYIVTEASQAEMDRILDSIKTRQRILRDTRAALVAVGARVKIINITPKALVGLTGTVVSITGRHGVVQLDAASTDALRFARTKFARSISHGQENYDLSGVPLSCCAVTD